jgi:hypothetical protein
MARGIDEAKANPLLDESMNHGGDAQYKRRLTTKNQNQGRLKESCANTS